MLQRLAGKSKGKKPLGRLDVNVRITLKWISSKRMGEGGTIYWGSGNGQLDGYFGHANEFRILCSRVNFLTS